ncbi:MAG TPA: DoxX family protein [Chloroflexota bacterium]
MSRIAQKQTVIENPPIARMLFDDTRLSWLWLIVRLYVGYTWITSGLGKLGSPAWTVTGDALKGFWVGAVAVPAGGKGPITFDWYRDFLLFLLNGQHYVWFSKLVVAGELTIGVCMILGAFVGFAAFFGGFMNWNFMMAGTASVNPVLLPLSMLLLVAWKTAGHIGADRFLLPLIGTPWRPTAARAILPAAQPAIAGGERE